MAHRSWALKLARVTSSRMTVKHSNDALAAAPASEASVSLSQSGQAFDGCSRTASVTICVTQSETRTQIRTAAANLRMTARSPGRGGAVA